MGRKKRKFRERTAHSDCVVVDPPSMEEKSQIQTSGENEVYTAIAYAGDTKECVNLPKRAPILMINSQTYGTLRCLMDKYPHTEWGMYLLGELDDDGDGICTSHLIPEQRVTGTSVLPDSTVDNVVCWLHSHHGMGAWHSGTDREYANYPFIATVSLQQGKFDISAKKRITLPCCSKYILVEANVQFFFSNVEEENVADENIRTPAPASVSPSGQLSLPSYNSPYTYYNNTVPPDANKYHPVGHPCKFGLVEKQEGCQWRCYAATKNYYKDSKQYLFCDEQRAQSQRKQVEAVRATQAFLNTPPASASREPETEAERGEAEPFAPACREAISIYAINGEKVVAVAMGTVCPAKGYTCQIGCQHAISCKAIEQGVNVVFCVWKAEERRRAALEEIYADQVSESPAKYEILSDTPMESD